MVAPLKAKKVFCTVVRVPATEDQGLANRFSTRPSRLLPWADPYIARLVCSLQDEIRNERSATHSCCNAAQGPRADLDPPSHTFESEGESTDDPRWTFWDDTYSD